MSIERITATGNETPLVVFVILNTNRRDDTLACLRSLERCSYRRHEVLVLDNASSDGSVEAIEAARPGVHILRLTENQGYAGNNNVGIEWALERGADWIVLLNEDTVVAPDCLQKMIEAAEADPRIGVVGPLVFHFDSPDTIQSAGGRLNRFWHATHIGANEQPRKRFIHPTNVDWISGCCIMVRRQVFEDTGLIDDRYFYYWEETELCIRARKQGWRIVHVPQARLWHKGVQINYSPPPSVTYYATRNRLLTLSKHRAPLLIRLVAWAEVIRTLSSWTVRPKWRSLRPHRKAMWQGLIDYHSQRWGKMSG